MDVSIIVPAYNASAWIGDALDSACSSTGVTIEVIVVDDASTDGTLSVVRSHASADPRIQVAQLPVNRGPSHARNVGIALASGEWIAFLDADDLYRPERLSGLVEHARSGHLDVVSDDVLLFTVAPSLATSMYDLHGVDRTRATTVTLEWIVESGVIIQPIIRRERFVRGNDHFDERLRHGEDFLLYVKILVSGAKWEAVPWAGYCYRVHETSITGGGTWAGDHEAAAQSALAIAVQSEDVTSGALRALRANVRRAKRGRLVAVARSQAAKREWPSLAATSMRLVQHLPEIALKRWRFRALRRLRADRRCGG